IIDRGGRYAEAGRLIAVDVDENREPLRRQVAGYIGELRKLVQLVDQLRRPFSELRRVGILKDKLILRSADSALDGEVLDRLHIKRDAGQRSRAVLEPLHDRRNIRFTLVTRLEIDQDSTAVERGVGAVHADKGRKALDIA